jgi:hypothetical protein
MHGLHFGEDTRFVGLDSIKKGAAGVGAIWVLIGHGAGRSLRIPFLA